MLSGHIVEGDAVMYPLCFNLKGKHLLFIGGGRVAERKIKSLLASDARITVVAPQESMSFKHENLRLINKIYDDEDITDEYYMVFVCTDNRGINAAAAKKAKELDIPVNIADDPQNCDFHMPSVINTDEYTISVSTNGKDPSKAKALRIKLEEFLKRTL